MKKIAVFGSEDSLKGLKKIELAGDIKVIPVKTIDFVKNDVEIKNISDFEWVFFGSKRGVKYFLEMVDLDYLKGLKIACVGEKTAEFLEKKGFKPDFVPSNNSSKHFFEEFTKNFSPEKGILFPTSNISKNDLMKEFSEKGILFKKIVVYKTVCADFVLEEDADAYIFLSPSSFKCFLEKNPSIDLKNKILCAIGSITAKEIEKHGLKCIFPEKYGLKEALKLTIKKLGGFYEIS